MTAAVRHARAYAVLARANQLIVRELPAADLLQQFCALAVDDAGYRLAWVGLAQDDASRTVLPVASHGFEVGYLNSIAVSWADDESGRGPTGEAIRSGRPVVFADLANAPAFAPWRDEAARRGYASSVALPLIDSGRAFGALNLYAVEVDAFDADELVLLQEVAADLAHGVRVAQQREALAQARAALDRADRLATTARVAATIAHDVNNLLAVIALASGELAEESDRDARAESRAAIDAAVGRANELLRPFLQFAARRRTSGPVGLDAALREAWPVLSRLPGPKHEVVLELEAGGACVPIDALSVEQIVLNLLVNARAATPAGGSVRVSTSRLDVEQPLTLTIGVLPPGSYARIRVADTGAGMTPDVAARIFEPFFTTKGTAGTGVGLPTVFSIVNPIGGGIAVTTRPGAGTTFDVWLPTSP